jgi:hypothetical protein
MKILAVIVSLALLPAVAAAHHSRAEFSSVIEEIQGELVEIAWRNPHPVLIIKVTDEDDSETLLQVEGWQSANSLTRKGITSEAFRVGDTVMAAVQESNRRPNLFLGSSISLGNGTQAILRPGYEPYWPDQQVIGSEPESSPMNTNENARGQGIFRVWTFVDRQGPGDLPLTAAARTKLDEFDELVDHPLWNCDPVGMPVAMDTGLPIEFVDHGSQIQLRIETNDSVRTIHLESNAASPASEPSAMGHSVGRWEGNSLIVTTSNSNYPYFDDDGTPKSVAMRFTESFTVNESDGTLTWEATMSDPEYLSRPVVITASWKSVPGETIEPWNCAVSG